MLSTGVLPRDTTAEAHAGDEASLLAVHSGQQEELVSGSQLQVQGEPQPCTPCRACCPIPGPPPQEREHPSSARVAVLGLARQPHSSSTPSARPNPCPCSLPCREALGCCPGLQWCCGAAQPQPPSRVVGARTYSQSTTSRTTRTATAVRGLGCPPRVRAHTQRHTDTQRDTHTPPYLCAFSRTLLLSSPAHGKRLGLGLRVVS